MPTDPRAWLRSLPATLAAQKTVMEALLERIERDDRVRLFIVGCSIGRGAADRLSDIDALIGVRPEAWSSSIASSPSWIQAASPVLDLYQQIIADAAFEGREYQHTFAQYADGVQLDLVLSRVRERQPPRADGVVLYDPDRRVSGEPSRSTPSADDVRRWSYVALTRLSACAKYLVRGSLWEAQLCLELARADLWRVWAVAERVADPQYGITAVLDDPRRPMPEGIEETTALLDKKALASAAEVCCTMLVESWPRAMGAVGAPDLPLPALSKYVCAQLHEIAP
jgi:hypothetical protein